MFEYNPYHRRPPMAPRRVRVWPPRPTPAQPPAIEPDLDAGLALLDQAVDPVTPLRGPASNELPILFDTAERRADAAGLKAENSRLHQALEKQQAQVTQLQQALHLAQAEKAALQVELEKTTAVAINPWQQRFLALQAEMGDLRARWQRRFAGEAEQEKQRLLRSFLPFADHLQWAVQHGDGSATALRPMLNDFLHTLEMEGVKPLEAAGQPFDPALHEAVSVTSADGVEPGTVVDVLNAGYRYQDVLLRPARVRVSQ